VALRKWCKDKEKKDFKSLPLCIHLFPLSRSLMERFCERLALLFETYFVMVNPSHRKLYFYNIIGESNGDNS